VIDLASPICATACGAQVHDVTGGKVRDIILDPWRRHLDAALRALAWCGRPGRDRLPRPGASEHPRPTTCW